MISKRRMVLAISLLLAYVYAEGEGPVIPKGFEECNKDTIYDAG